MTYKMTLGEACNLCGECVESCPANALSITDESLQYDGKICQYCETCIDVCEEYAIKIERI